MVTGTVKNSIVFAAGSDDLNGASGVVEILDLTTQTMRKSNTSRSGTFIALSGSKFIIFVNIPSFLQSNISYIYDVEKDYWETIPLPRGGFGSNWVTYKDLIFQIGGYVGTGSCDTCYTFSNTTNIYNITSKAWKTISFPQLRVSGYAMNVKDLIVLVGGYLPGGGIMTNRVDVYNITSDRWIGNSSFQISGVIQCKPIRDGVVIYASANVLLFNTTTFSWTTVPLPFTRTQFSLETNDNLVYFAGGSLVAYTDTVDVLDVVTLSWNSTRLSAARTGASSTSGHGYVAFGGGYTSGGQYSNAVDVFCIQSTPNFTCPFSNILSSSALGTFGTFGTSLSSSSSSSSLQSSKSENGNSSSVLIAVISVAVIFAALLLAATLIIVWLVMRQRRREMNRGSLKDLDLINPTSIYTVSDVVKSEQIGKGNFGMVYRGTMDKSIQVALKTLRGAEKSEEFIREIAVLCKLNHPNLVRFYGIHYTAKNETFMVLEYMGQGSLIDLLSKKQETITKEDLLFMMKHIVNGMRFLEQNNIIHRDLALRNILVDVNLDGKYILKITDFGMSRVVEPEEYYTSDNKVLPWRWCAPESITKGKFSHKSDIWSCGVCLWEMFSFGQIPYWGSDHKEVILELTQGKRLSKPLECPTEIYDTIMMKCWAFESDKRPSFKELNIIVDEVTSQIQRTSFLVVAAKVKDPSPQTSAGDQNMYV